MVRYDVLQAGLPESIVFHELILAEIALFIPVSALQYPSSGYFSFREFYWEDTIRDTLFLQPVPQAMRTNNDSGPFEDLPISCKL